MKALEKAKLALRKHLLSNKEQVVADLAEMRRKSEGNDIFNYVENLSNAFSFENVSTSTEITYDYTFDEVDSYDFLEDFIDTHLYSPPDKQDERKRKKGSEILSESFFLIILYYDNRKRSSVLI